MWKKIQKAQIQTFSHSVGLNVTSSFFCNQNTYNTRKLRFDIPLKNCKTFWNLRSGKKVAVFIFSLHKFIIRIFLFSKNSCNVLRNFTYFTIKLFVDGNFKNIVDGCFQYFIFAITFFKIQCARFLLIGYITFYFVIQMTVKIPCITWTYLN